tara:strand:+ start:240 stop:494 length:255 start_codon:yes stop_codon:yes gene_type:complete
MAWNFNIDEAPQGRIEKREKTVKGKPFVKEVFVAEPVIVASKCGKVIVTHCLPNGRWSMFTADSPPIAWQHKPAHPSLSTVGEG